MGEKDFLNQLEADVDLTTSGVSAFPIDFGHANPNKGRGTPLEVEATIKTPGVGTSILFDLRDCDTEGGAYVVIAQSRVYTGAELVAGKLVQIPLPDEHRRFLKWGRTPTTMTGGTADVFLQP